MTAKTRLGSRVGKWLALVVACALPLEAFIWNKEELLRQQFAVLLGVVIWIAVMAGLDAWLLRRGRTRASRALGFGALAFAVIQGILAVVSINGLTAGPGRHRIAPQFPKPEEGCTWLKS
jgi:hypothetical protein